MRRFFIVLVLAIMMTAVSHIAMAEMPENMIVDEAQWEEWEASGKCKLFPFMGAGKEVGFSYTIPKGQSDSAHKKCSFVFQGGNKDGESLKKVEMYYGVQDQTIVYLGLWTENEEIFKSEDFREACIRLMLAYNNHFDKDAGKAVLNLSRERAEELVEYCLDKIEHCVVDDMRIRVIRNQADNYFSFHMEY